MSIHYKYQFNDSDYAEIHHGERFHLDYSFSNVKYLILFHKRPVSLKQSSPKDKKINWPIGSFLNWIKITKPSGRFESVANAYEPDIVFYCFKSYLSLRPIKFNITMNLLFVNVIENTFSFTTSLSEDPIETPKISFDINTKKLKLNTPKINFKYQLGDLHLNKSSFQVKKNSYSFEKLSNSNNQTSNEY